MYEYFDHRRCPTCDELMRVSSIQPRVLFREPEYERHTYHCDACGNMSEFVFEMPSRAHAA